MWLVSIPVSKYLILSNGNDSFSLCNGYPWLSAWRDLGSAKRHASQWVCKVSTGSLTEGESITPEWATVDGLSRYKVLFLMLDFFPFRCLHLLCSRSSRCCCYCCRPFWQSEPRFFGLSMWPEDQQFPGNPQAFYAIQKLLRNPYHGLRRYWVVHLIKAQAVTAG